MNRLLPFYCQVSTKQALQYLLKLWMDPSQIKWKMHRFITVEIMQSTQFLTIYLAAQKGTHLFPWPVWNASFYLCSVYSTVLRENLLLASLLYCWFLVAVRAWALATLDSSLSRSSAHTITRTAVVAFSKPQ